jgi:hypothetical protein
MHLHAYFLVTTVLEYSVNTVFITIRKSTKRICVMNAPMVRFGRTFASVGVSRTFLTAIQNASRDATQSFFPSTITSRGSPWGTIVPASRRVRRFAFTLLGHSSDPRLRYYLILYRGWLTVRRGLSRNQLARRTIRDDESPQTQVSPLCRRTVADRRLV